MPDASPPAGVPAPAIPGNLDPWRRKVWAHPNHFAPGGGGTYGTTLSISITDENPKSPLFGKEVLIPTVINGYPFSQADARQHYANTGEHLGAFPAGQYDQADQYAQWLHEEQARRIEGPSLAAPPPVKADPPPQSATPAFPFGRR